MAEAGCQYVAIGGSLVTAKEHPNDFDAFYDDILVNDLILDSVFDDFNLQQQRFGGEFHANPFYQGFLQTDREGNSRGIVVLDPRKVI